MRIEEVLELVTVDLVNRIGHGEEIELDSEYTLYCYVEHDIIVVVRTEDWCEIFQVMINGDELEFEALTYE